MTRRAVLFGCNYAGTNNALSGCINDVRAVYEMLEYAYQFDPQVLVQSALQIRCLADLRVGVHAAAQISVLAPA